MTRIVHCARCGKPIAEGQEAVRRKHYTGWFCSFRCLALEMGIAETKTVTDEIVKEDEEETGYGWDEKTF